MNYSKISLCISLLLMLSVTAMPVSPEKKHSLITTATQEISSNTNTQNATDNDDPENEPEHHIVEEPTDFGCPLS